MTCNNACRKARVAVHCKHILSDATQKSVCGNQDKVTALYYLATENLVLI